MKTTKLIYGTTLKKDEALKLTKPESLGYYTMTREQRKAMTTVYPALKKYKLFFDKQSDILTLDEYEIDQVLILAEQNKQATTSNHK